MRFASNQFVFLVVGFVGMVCFTACNSKQDDKTAILAIWQIRSINVNGMEIGDGKGFLHFHEDGTVQSRTGPGIYDDGRFELDQEKKVLVMKQDSSQLKYSYALAGDSLTMQSNEGGMALKLKSFKVDKLPINPEEDVLPENMFKPTN